MTIYFLQHLKPPVLPVLHEIIDFRTISPTQINGHNHHSNNNNNSKNKNAKANRTKKQKIRNPNRGDQDESENSDDEDNELQPDDDNDDDESINNLDFRIFETNLANYVCFFCCCYSLYT